MEVIAIKAKAHEYDFYSQFFFQDRTNGNAATAANRDGVFAKSGLYGLCGSLVALAVDGRHIGFSAMVQFGFYGYSSRRLFFEIIDQEFGDLV